MSKAYITLLIIFMYIRYSSSCISRGPKKRSCNETEIDLTPFQKCNITSPELVALPNTKCILKPSSELLPAPKSNCSREYEIMACSDCVSYNECVYIENCLRRYKILLECVSATEKDLPKNSLPQLQGLMFLRSTIPIVKKQLFKNFPQMKILRAGNNRIEAIEDDAFQNMGNLSSVDVSYNKIKKISPELFKNCLKIRSFHASGNLGLTVPENEPFLNLPQLKRLYLQECSIERISASTFKNLPGLFRLNLAKNNIKVLPGDVFKPMSNLWWLDLSGNKLRTISLSAFAHVRPPLVMLLMGNPWECDCALYPLIEFSKSRGYYTDDVACVKPNNKKWKEVVLNCPR